MLLMPPSPDAVMAKRAKKEVPTDTPLQRLQRQLDFFPTPPWASRAGGEQLLQLDPSARIIREPACGEMHMAAVLQERFEVIASDVHPWSPNTPVADWLDDAAWPDEPDCDWVMTNPPFAIADQFVKRGLRRSRKGVALLLRLAFLEGGDRHAILEGSNPLTLLAPFSERVPMTLGKWQPEASSATAYAWFFWMKDASPRPISFIGPGTRDRLWMANDADRFGFREPMPLFDGPLDGPDKSVQPKDERGEVAKPLPA